MSIKLMRVFLFIPMFLLINGITLAQTDWVKWGKAEYSYKADSTSNKHDYSLNARSAGKVVLKSLADAYWFFISDLDGDNCPFAPTCSNFFIQSVEMTNLFQGTLMFFDRFTRDMDIFGKLGHYPRVSGGRFFDPPSLYILDNDSIKYIPPSVVVKNE